MNYFKRRRHGCLASGSPRHCPGIAADRQRQRRQHQRQRQRRQQQRRQADQHWRAAVEAAGGGIWDCDLQAGTCFFSPRWTAMLGCAPHEIGHDPAPWQQAVRPDDRARWLATGPTAPDDGRADDADDAGEYRIRRQRGRYSWARSLVGGPKRVRCRAKPWPKPRRVR